MRDETNDRVVAKDLNRFGNVEIVRGEALTKKIHESEVENN